MVGKVARYRQANSALFCFHIGVTFPQGVFCDSHFLFVIFMFGNFRLTAATTEECSGFPELLASASRAWEASGMGYFLAPFSTKSDFGSRFLFAALSFAIAVS